ncbi:hypothetical protein J3R75_002061 [Oligosphaera ethanolica]|uniref:Uncharacterized protein n=1 Tax=Oligosphaera ethanolica TaxID=760260 RepID=A0AAE3VGX1_9BACT|nr:hypothetical protein [Oligosphaera ethanolica]
MDWTPGTFWTVGNDALDAGDCLADYRDSWERRSPGGIQPGSNKSRRLNGQVRPGGPHHA